MAYLLSTTTKNSVEVIDLIKANLPAGWASAQDVTFTGSPAIISGTYRRLSLTNPSGEKLHIEAQVNPTQAQYAGLYAQVGGEWVIDTQSTEGQRSITAQQATTRDEPDSFQYPSRCYADSSVIGLYEWQNFVSVHLFTHPEMIYVVIELKNNFFVHFYLFSSLIPLATYTHGQLIGGTQYTGEEAAQTQYRYRFPWTSQQGLDARRDKMKISGMTRLSSGSGTDTFTAYVGEETAINSSYDGIIYPNLAKKRGTLDRYLPGGAPSDLGGIGAYAKTLAHPIRLFSGVPDPQYSPRTLLTPIAEVPNLRGVNLRETPPGFEFIDNGDTYKIFPITGKTGSMAPAIDDDGYLCLQGVAIKK